MPDELPTAAGDTVEELVIHDDATLRDALQRIDESAAGIAFVTNREGRLVGVLTDGDIRRALLKGAALDASASEYMNRDPVSLRISCSDMDISSALDGTRIRVIPLTDGDGRPVDYASMMRHRRIPAGEPTLDGNEALYVEECLRTNWISSQGRFVQKFESEFASYIGSPTAVSTSSGTTALHLALLALGIGPGDEVIVPDLTFVATANAVVHAGAKPVIVDVDRETWNMDPIAAQAAITRKTKAILPVHLYGLPADMDAIMKLARSHRLLVIEDAAEALGASYDGRRVGALGDAAVFSFYANKMLTTGEGGMATFRHPEAAERARRLRDHGMVATRRYWHDIVGYNYRMTNVQAAIGCAQLERIDQLLEKKLSLGRLYAQELSGLNGITSQVTPSNRSHVYWGYSVRLDTEKLGISRDALLERLARRGIEARPTFYPLHTMPSHAAHAAESCPVSKSIGLYGITLPSATGLQDQDVIHVAETLRSMLDVRALLDDTGAMRLATGP